MESFECTEPQCASETIVGFSPHSPSGELDSRFDYQCLLPRPGAVWKNCGWDRIRPATGWYFDSTNPTQEITSSSVEGSSCTEGGRLWSNQTYSACSSQRLVLAKSPFTGTRHRYSGLIRARRLPRMVISLLDAIWTELNTVSFMVLTDTSPRIGRLLMIGYIA